MKPTLTDNIQNCTAKIAASDKQAFDRLFRQLYPMLVRYAYKYVRQKSVAGDIVQEAFMKLWEKRADLDPNGSVKAYLYRMVRNRSLNYKRDHAKEKIGLDDLPPQNSGDEINVQKQGSLQNVMPLVEQWIRDLPARQREAFQLSRFEGLDHEEIADVMDISPNTVNNHIVAALDKLRVCFHTYKNEKREG